MFILPARSHHWHSIIPPPPPPLPAPTADKSPYVTDVLHVTVPAQKNVKCPVTKHNRDSWTEIHREKASKGVVAESVEHLERLVRPLFTPPFSDVDITFWFPDS
jgi:hypothetical protein